MTEAKSAQPQLPPLDDCPRCKGSGQVESTSFVDKSKSVTRKCHLCHGTGKLPRNSEDLERQLLSALAENESLKATLKGWIEKYGKAGAIAVRAEAERDQALELIREYRKSAFGHRGCTVSYSCPTCIKAGELLSRETKEEK